MQSAALTAQLERAQHMLTQAPQPCTLEAALEHTHVYTSAHAHMLAVGSQTGSLPATLTQIAAAQAQAAYAALERAVGAVEPVLAALMTLGVCAALMAVMLPLVGIMVAMA
jgi:type II secretory pathway component PulF